MFHATIICACNVSEVQQHAVNMESLETRCAILMLSCESDSKSHVY